MIIVLKPDVRAEELKALEEKIQSHGNKCQVVEGAERRVLAVLGTVSFDAAELRDLPGVAQVLRVGRPYKLASREVKPERTVVRVGDVEFGGDGIVVIAGPCAVESREMLLKTARLCAAAGVTVLRGGAFKPRTSPYAFQGLGEEGLEILAEAREETGLKIVTEVMTPARVEIVAKYADILQIGARNMQNYDLLRECAQVNKPVLLKRGLSATIDELLQSAEYILAAGKNPNVILCERGIRTFETSTRNTLDLNAIPVLRDRTHLPVVVDPSHGTGVRSYVIPMARAAIAAGADGIIAEVHAEPEKALSDGPQSILPEQLETLLRDLKVIAPVVGRHLDLRTTRPPVPVKARKTDAEVAFQGERGAFSEKAARQVFGTATKALPCPTFRDVFDAVVGGRAQHGILPVENTLGGSVLPNYDLLSEYDAQITAETKLRVIHNLIGNRGARLSDIRKVYAHPQAAAQCERFLRLHPEWTVYQVYDTAGSVKMIKEEGIADGAAIAGAAAAKEFDMEILKEGIESDPQNYTRFVVISAESAPPKSANRASLVYGTKDEPGALLRTLEVFDRRGINLTKLESRPIPGRPWEYLFYVDLNGVPDEDMIRELKEHTTQLKVLGIYSS